MLPNYEDILSRIAEPPRWFDEQGVPRYCEFAPDRIANIHAQECALLAIECQSCGRPFIVALDGGTANHNVIRRPGQEREWRTLADIIRSHQIEYRDPPNVACCGVGAMQTSTIRRVLEYWERIQETYKDPDGRATTALKSKYRRGNRFSLCWRIRPMTGPGSRLRPESSSRPMRVTIPCAKSQCMIRSLIGYLIDR